MPVEPWFLELLACPVCRGKLVEAADRGTPEEYVTNVKAAQRILANDAASIWLWMLPNLVVTKANVSGVAQNATSLSFDVTTIAEA